MQDTDTLPASSYLPNLGALLADRGIKQLTLAWELVRDPGLVSDWTKGKRRVPGTVLPRLAELLELSLADLLTQGSYGQINGELYRVPDEAADDVDQVAEPEPEPPRTLAIKFGTIDTRMLGRSPQRLCYGCPDHPRGLVR